MLRPTGRRIDLCTPFVDAMLPDGSRLHVVIPNITRRHMAVNIRKFAVGLRSLDELVAAGSLTEQAARFLEASRRGRAERPRRRRHPGRQDHAAQRAVRRHPGARAGGHGRGGVRAQRCGSPDVVAMQTRQANLEGTGEIPLRRLVKEALRMRPSRLIVGEVRQEECLDLLIALNSGLPGMCTLHANSAREALVKMCTLPLLAGENVSAAFVVPTVAASVDLVVHLGMDASGHAAGARDRRRHRPGRGRRHRDQRAVRAAPRTPRARATASRRTPSATRRPASTWPQVLGHRADRLHAAGER